MCARSDSRSLRSFPRHLYGPLLTSDGRQVEVVKDKLRVVKSLQRGKHMDEWSIDELASFFTELKMDQYCQFLYSNKSASLLFELLLLLLFV
jgi:hypothetical protein